MYQGFAIYLAMRQHDWGPGHTPQPPARRRPTPSRPRLPSRWIRKLRVQIPAAFAFLRGTLRLPLTSQRPSTGSRVVSVNGEPLGTVLRVVVALDTRRPLYAIAPGDEQGPPPTVVVLVTDDQLRDHADRDTYVLEEPQDQMWLPLAG